MNLGKVPPERKAKWDDQIRFLELRAGPEMLNDWEWNFVTHMEALRRNGNDLSLQQSFKLNEIFHNAERKIG